MADNENQATPTPGLKRVQIPTLTLDPTRTSDLFFNAVHPNYAASIGEPVDIVMMALRQDARDFAEQLITRDDEQFDTLVEALVVDFFNRL